MVLVALVKLGELLGVPKALLPTAWLATASAIG